MLSSLTVGVRKSFGKFLLGKETFEVEQSLPHQQCKLRGAHQAVPRGTGILSSLFLYTSLKTFGCPGMPLVRSCLESTTFRGGRCSVFF